MTPKSEMLDKLQLDLQLALKSIPSGGGEMGAYGIAKYSEEAANIIRKMIELARLP